MHIFNVSVACKQFQTDTSKFIGGDDNTSFLSQTGNPDVLNIGTIFHLKPFETNGQSIVLYVPAYIKSTSG